MFDIAKAKNTIDRHEVVSFDIFDTLVTRPTYKPADSFYFIEQFINSNVDNCYVPFNFLEERVKAEQTVRSQYVSSGRNPDTATLHNIYMQLSLQTNLPLETTKKLMDYEIKYELRTILPYSLGIDLFQYAHNAGKRIFVLSDMYLPINTVTSILEKVGCATQERLVLSCHDGICKSDGSTYAALLMQEHIVAQNWLHVGDNHHSDIQVAATFGISTVLVPKKEAFLSVPQHITHFRTYNEVGITERAGSLEAYSALSGLMFPEKASDFWWRIGNEIAGQAHVGFVDWLAKQANEQTVDTLLFLARDGQIIERVYDRALAHKRINGPKEHHYVYASRRLYNFASIDQLNASDIDFILSGTTPLTAAQYLERINMLNNESRSMLEQYGVLPDQPINEYTRQKMRSILWLFAPFIEKQAQKERRKLVRYLQSLGIENRRVGIVDIGWHGSMQRALQKILSIENVPCTVIGFYFGLHDSAKPSSDKYAYLSETADAGLYRETVRRSVEVIELLFSADHPTIVGLGPSSQPIYGVQTTDGLSVTALQDGIISFANSFYAGSLPINLTVDVCMQALARLINMPTLQEALHIGQVVHYEGFGHNGKLAGRPIAQAPKRYYFFAGRKKWQQARQQSFWQAGFAKQVESKFLFRARRKIIKTTWQFMKNTRQVIKRTLPKS